MVIEALIDIAHFPKLSSFIMQFLRGEEAEVTQTVAHTDNNNRLS
jgi:hypothetical protein